MKNFEHPFLDDVLSFVRVNSTMQKATDLIKKKEISGNTLIVAEKQTSGKGRTGNSWFSPEGGLWFTLCLSNVSLNSNLTLFMGCLMRDSIAEYYPGLAPFLKLKWPNDIYYNDRKIAGILVTQLTYHKYYLIGIGLNTNVSDFPEIDGNNPDSLLSITGKTTDHSELLRIFFDKLYQEFPHFIESGFKKYIENFNNNAYLTGKQITISTEFQDFSGIVKGINSDGAILLELQNRMIQPFYSGTITRVE